MKRQVGRNIAPAEDRSEADIPVLAGMEYGLPPFVVTLAGYGNPDYGQDPSKAICKPAEGIVKSIEDGTDLVRFYTGENQLGAGNWVLDAGEVRNAEGIYIGRYSYNGRFWKINHKDGYGLPHEFSLPYGISQLGIDAATVIVTVLAEYQALSTGGCRPFWSPEEWLARGNKFCKNSELIILHDGGELSSVFGEFGEPYQEISEALKRKKLYVEGCTSVYSAVYPIEPIKIPK